MSCTDSEQILICRSAHQNYIVVEFSWMLSKTILREFQRNRFAQRQLTDRNEIHMIDDHSFATGSCRCGAVSLVINAKPKMMMQCHCLDCQKLTGTGHASYAMFTDEDVIIQGEATGHMVVVDSGSEMPRYFCSNFGGSGYGLNSERLGIV